MENIFKYKDKEIVIKEPEFYVDSFNQGSDYKAIKIIKIIDDVDMDSNNIYLKINRDKLNIPPITTKDELKYFVADLITEL